MKLSKKSKLLLVAGVGVPLAGLVLFNTFFEKVPIDRVGVVINQLAIAGGVEPRDYKPGYVFVAPVVHKLELLDPTYQSLTLGKKELRLKDGFKTVVDLTLVYRIRPGEANMALQRLGEGANFKTRLFTISDKYIWEVMTELATEDFYNSDKRHDQAKIACDLMNVEFENEHLEVADVLIRDITYDEGFENLLKQKQRLDQEKLLFDSQRKLADEKKITELIERETRNMTIRIEQEKQKAIVELIAGTDAAIAKMEADARRDAETLVAQAQSTARKKIAEGDLAKVKARAEGEKAINAAYQEPGGDLYIARQIVQNLSFGEIEINTNQTNPFDVGQMLKMIGVDATGDAARAAGRPASGSSAASSSALEAEVRDLRGDVATLKRSLEAERASSAETASAE